MKDVMEKKRARDLIKAAQAGDRNALESLLSTYSERLEARIRARMGKHLRQLVDVEDVMQETFVWATKSVGRFQWRGEDSFFQWLGGIAEHMLQKAASQKKRNSHLELGRDIPANKTSPSRAAKRQERFDRLQKALESLSPEYRDVIMLSRIEGLRAGEIAKRMGRSPNAVALLLSRALKKLKTVFGKTESLHLPDKTFTLNGTDNDPA